MKLLKQALTTGMIALASQMSYGQMMKADGALQNVANGVEQTKQNMQLGYMNLKVVEFNVFNIQKVQQNILIDEKRLETQKSSTAKVAKSIFDKEKQIRALIAKEEENMAKDQKKMDQVMAVLEQLKTVQSTRNANIDFYKDQLQSMKVDNAGLYKYQEELNQAENTLKQRKAEMSGLEKAQLEIKKNTLTQTQEWEKKHQQQKQSYEALTALLNDRK